jgi:hypothetical protein
VISSNSQGDKFKDLASLVIRKNASVFMIQETQARKKGKHQLEHFCIFEAKRTKVGGGSMMGIHESMNPVLISAYEDEFELIVVQTKVWKKEIRFITGYGPQEDWTDDKKAPFYIALDQEISKAQDEGKSVYIAMDANAKLGSEFIPGDPNKISKNGEILAEIVEKNGLIVANGLTEKCQGVITRQRTTEDGRCERSVIDFVLVSADLVESIISLKIDEERTNVLTKITKTKKAGVKKTESDHNIIEADLQIKWNKNVKKEKEEMYNLKNKECQKKFKEHTTNTQMSRIFRSPQHLDILTKKFMNALDGAIIMCFRKYRNTRQKIGRVEELYQKRSELKECNDKKNDAEIAEIEKEIAEETCKVVEEETKGLDSESGAYNPGHLWKLKNKIIPKPNQVPTAMKGPDGKLLTTKSELQKNTMDHYKNVLRNRTINEELKEHQSEREMLCKLRLEQTKENKTSDWTKADLVKVLKELKNKKSRDPNSYINEIFNPEVAGDDLIEAILILMNRIKEEGVYPKALEMCNITSLYKMKGPRNEFGSYRGIFRVQAFRNILERLMYNDEYPTIDSNLTDCNVGARKNRNIRDNIFVLNAIMNDAVNGSKEAIDIAIYDVEKCFDALWVEECINDLYDAGLRNNNLNVLYLMNQNAQVAIKTPSGMTKRQNISNVVMQGTVWGSLFCTTTMDKLGKLKYKNEEMLFKYKGEVGVPALEMVDDIVDIQKCGTDAIKANGVLNAANSIVERKVILVQT